MIFLCCGSADPRPRPRAANRRHYTLVYWQEGSQIHCKYVVRTTIASIHCGLDRILHLQYSYVIIIVETFPGLNNANNGNCGDISRVPWRSCPWDGRSGYGGLSLSLAGRLCKTKLGRSDLETFSCFHNNDNGSNVGTFSCCHNSSMWKLGWNVELFPSLYESNGREMSEMTVEFGNFYVSIEEVIVIWWNDVKFGNISMFLWRKSRRMSEMRIKYRNISIFSYVLIVRFGNDGKMSNILLFL